MSTWRRIALETLPELRQTIERADSPMVLWIELHWALERAYCLQPPDDDRIARLYRYAEWSWDSPNADARSAVACAFYEHIPQNGTIARDLSRWMTTERFRQLEEVFRYFLSEEQFQKFRTRFLDRREHIGRSLRSGR